jgi:hypothetical protein
MSGGDNLHLPPGDNGTLVFDASGGVTSLAGDSSPAPSAGVAVFAVSRTHLSARHAGHHAARHHATHHAVPHPKAARSHKLPLGVEHQPF